MLIESAIAGLQIDVALRIHGRAAAAVPEAAFGRRWGWCYRHWASREVGGIVAKQPAMIRRVVSVRGKRQIDGAIEQRQRGPAVLAQRIPQHMRRVLAVIVAAASAGIIRALDDDRAVEVGSLKSGCNVQRMQTMHVGGACLPGS